MPVAYTVPCLCTYRLYLVLKKLGVLDLYRSPIEIEF